MSAAWTVEVTVESNRLEHAWVLDAMAGFENGVRAMATTERAESSQGLPVVVVDGTAYGPGDLGAHEVIVWGAGRADAARVRLALRLAGYHAPEPEPGPGPETCEPADDEVTHMPGGWETY